MQAPRSTFGLCNECIKTSGVNMFESKKPNHCITCQKQPEVLFNQDPYCSSCYIQTISSPTKSQRSSQTGHRKNKSFYRPIDKEEVKVMKKSFLGSSGKLIKKISKIFQQNQNQSHLVGYLNKKGHLFGNIQWQKFIPKVTKTSNIVYIFIGKTYILGAFHSQSVNIQGQASVWDQESGIFKTQVNKFQLQFARVKADTVIYSCKTKQIKFGSPSSFQISFDKNLKVTSELAQNFQWVHCFIYRP